ncbi:hypothetical protein [Frankia sp. CcWB2]
MPAVVHEGDAAGPAGTLFVSLYGELAVHPWRDSFVASSRLRRPVGDERRRAGPAGRRRGVAVPCRLRTPAVGSLLQDVGWFADCAPRHSTRVRVTVDGGQDPAIRSAAPAMLDWLCKLDQHVFSDDSFSSANDDHPVLESAVVDELWQGPARTGLPAREPSPSGRWARWAGWPPCSLRRVPGTGPAPRY